MTEITLKLTINEVNGILAALGELPVKTGAFTLVGKIQAQAEPQVPKEEKADAQEAPAQ
jgi:hypothetical protein